MKNRLLALGAANKPRFIPALKVGDPHAAGHLSRSLSIEGGRDPDCAGCYSSSVIQNRFADMRFT
ncbi:hypothetical protein OS189_18030 [Sulfitobacter sp. F26169L]|uniref:hypothetical protein n=1 Tax=Sulfitobacter sp. F26169L TaxID=2996015 RepID=UPI0022608951|nr:hypothetical protein [Sulfitobacter sp. F26169L]MCX7568242.1 hypothetical protein [Sulfitobacter sp. F26169L]